MSALQSGLPCLPGVAGGLLRCLGGAVCRLGHAELLDAAHITPDRSLDGVPAVSNGLSLYKLHPAAYVASFIAVTPDYRVEVRRNVLDEEDGPMLQHGLQGTH